MKNFLKENIDKYGIINLIIWVSIPVIIALIVFPRYNSNSSSSTSSSMDTSSSSSSYSSFTNKYGTPTTKCHHNGCDKYIASSGDTNCCTIHSNKCKICGKYIDEDALVCIDCTKKELEKKK